ncbi:MAG: hypothetical protein GX027_09770 [Clostridiaceae bacterium]|jgi:hypothetical protein|nr:hypothetical protein [Clostridiaceae bacterium]
MKPSNKAFGIITLSLKPALALALACLTLSSCGQAESKDQQEQKQKQEHEKAMMILEEIETVNESIIQLLEGPANPGKDENRNQQGSKQPDQRQEEQGQQQGKDQPQGEDQKGNEPQQGEGQQDQQQGGDQQGGEQQDQQQKEEAQQGGEQQEKDIDGLKPQDAIWDGVNQDIIELHSLLNEYIPAASRLGASAELATNASNTLNQLTKKAEAKSHNEVLNEANNLFKAICDYYALHQDKRAPAKLLLFHARRVMLSAKVGDWQTAVTAMNDLETAWNTQKNAFGEEQKDTTAMLDLSVSNLAGAVAEKNQNLVAIKGLIVLQNISELEKSLEEK